MKKNKLLAAVLCLALCVSLLLPANVAWAEPGETPDSGMYLNKTATANSADGSYTITLEAYATGSKVTTQVSKDIPTDIILVLDQSGSMDDPMTTYGFKEYTDKTNYFFNSVRYNQNSADKKNLYYKLSNGTYASVSVTVQPTYRPYDERTSNSTYNNNEDNLYALVNGEYRQVGIEEKNGKGGKKQYRYYYLSWNDWRERIYISDQVSGADSVPQFYGITGNTLYYRDDGADEYIYRYTDANGDLQTIGTSTGANTKPTEFTLYQRYEISSEKKRIEALQEAVTGFANSVGQKARGTDGQWNTADDVNHRVAVVGFATGDSSNHSDYPIYENTELFIGSQEYNYNENASSYYGSALQSMNTEAGYNNVIASKDALAARGATYPNYGLEMAKGILDANPVESGEQRNRVVVLFTDGAPGYSSYSPTVAQSAIDKAKALKDAGVTVYSVGIFEGADASSRGDPDGDDTAKANWFMQKVSSNNGTPQTPSFYLSASDSDSLNSIFQQISQNIETGGSTTTLDENAVVQDIIAPQFVLPENANKDSIRVEVYSSPANGIEGQWTKDEQMTNDLNALEDSVEIVSVDNADGTKTQKVNVKGFDFAGNYVGMDENNGVQVYHPGKKLVISFEVVPNPLFLGGNNIDSNTNAFIFENGSATEPTCTFEKPKVNVPLNVNVDAPDKNIYLLQGLTAAQIGQGVTATVRGVPISLDLTDANYGLKSWQNEFVTITATITDSDGNTVLSLPDATSNDLTNLQDDKTYTVTVTVVPNADGTEAQNAGGGTATSMEGVSDTDDGAINIFKPELTFQDSVVFYREDAPDFDKVNWDKNATTWKHGETKDGDVTMIGTKPDLTCSYTPANAGSISSHNKIATMEDIPVNVAVKINGTDDITTYTTFVHKDCSNCAWDHTVTVGDGEPAFNLHVRTYKLTIEKNLDGTNSKMGDDATFLFEVKNSKNEVFYGVITIPKGKTFGRTEIVGLPSGTYTVTELTTAGYDLTTDNGVTPNFIQGADGNFNATVSFTNDAKDDTPYGDSSTVRNKLTYEGGTWNVSRVTPAAS